MIVNLHWNRLYSPHGQSLSDGQRLGPVSLTLISERGNVWGSLSYGVMKNCVMYTYQLVWLE